MHEAKFETLSKQNIIGTRFSPDNSVQYLKGVGPTRAKKFLRLNIKTVQDLFFHFPRKYLDRTKVSKISQIQPNVEVVIHGEIRKSSAKKYFRKAIVKCVVTDGTGYVVCTWFNKPYLKNILREGEHIFIAGKPLLDVHSGSLVFNEPDFDVVSGEEDSLNTTGIIPIYPQTEGITSKFIRKVICNAMNDYLKSIEDPFPYFLCKRNNLCSLQSAIQQIHYPTDFKEIDRAQYRIKFQEFFFFQLALFLRKSQFVEENKAISIKMWDGLDKRIRARLPWQLTLSQEKVIREIMNDLSKERPMNRLLQGDVGSGKTLVALYASLATIANKAQVCLMAPTEILAEQHFTNIKRYLKDSKVRLSLLVGATKQKEKKKIVEDLKNHNIDFVIGTHSLIEENVQFAKLALVIIDEQHKFGVMQRARLITKGSAPHTLIMTATPIPRTLALTAYGDLDISVIDRLPPGRKPVVTKSLTRDEIDKVFDFARKEIMSKRQIYFVFPVIDPSENTNLRSATEMYEYLKREVFPEFQVELLHGRMKKEEKEEKMSRFRSGEIDVLVSTIVIEVGIDVPNASVMVICNAERYGLSQLHQLRGRIGRGTQQSYCFLVSESKTEDAKERLKALEETNDGFKIAEVDLRMRGPGEFLGTRQHGIFNCFRLANILKDYSVLKKARAEAEEITRRDRNSALQLFHSLKNNFFPEISEELLSVG